MILVTPETKDWTHWINEGIWKWRHEFLPSKLKV
uniref:Uncharacterized protein n=1 Tax=Rhizophora mucronata TaxID=61149 RepID=A0A2P2PZQ1_RHIMU